MAHILVSLATVLFMHAALVCQAQTTPADSSEPTEKFGVGLRMGQPTGISAKVYLANKRALDMAVSGRQYAEHKGYGLRVNYLWQFDYLRGYREHLDLYLGPGLQFRDIQAPAVGFNGIMGMEYTFSTDPITLFLEAGPYVELVQNNKQVRDQKNDTIIFLFTGAGVRFNFTP